MNNILRRAALVVGALLVLLVLVAAGGYAVSQGKINMKYEIESESIPIPTDSISIARGRHLVRAIVKCADCHTADLGGEIVIDNGPMGRVISRNLTRGKGGIGAIMKDEDWVRAIRHGVGRDGRALVIMPSSVYQNLSVGDIGQIIAYLKSVPPVDRELGAISYGPVMRGLTAANQVSFFDATSVDHAKHAPALAPAEGPTAEYGDYLVHTAGCAGCHGPTLAGGKIEVGDPAWPPAANLTPTGLQAYDEAAFFTALRTGVRPGGSQINPAMPWKWAKEMTDDEIRAVWAYLKTVPPREFGAR
jgi:cytochrome c553